MRMAKKIIMGLVIIAPLILCGSSILNTDETNIDTLTRDMVLEINRENNVLMLKDNIEEYISKNLEIGLNSSMAYTVTLLDLNSKTLSMTVEFEGVGKGSIYEYVIKLSNGGESMEVVEFREFRSEKGDKASAYMVKEGMLSDEISVN